MNIHPRSVVLQLAAVVLLLTCSSSLSWSQTPAQFVATSPEVQSTANWNTTKHGPHLTIRVNPDANLPQYGSIHVRTVAYTGPARKLTPQQSEQLTALLHDSLLKDLSTTKLSSKGSATETLTIDADITKVKRSHPVVNVITIAAVFVPLDLGEANVTARLVDQKTGQVIAQIETIGCGQIYQVLGSLQAIGQSKTLLKKESRVIAREVANLNWNQRQSTSAGAASSGE